MYQVRNDRRAPTRHWRQADRVLCRQDAAHKAIAADVNRLKSEQMSNPQIIAWLVEHRGMKVGHATIRRAWNHANPRAVKKAMEDRTTPRERSQYPHLPAETFGTIKLELAGGQNLKNAALAARCSPKTAYRGRSMLEIEDILTMSSEHA